MPVVFPPNIPKEATGETSKVPTAGTDAPAERLLYRPQGGSKAPGMMRRPGDHRVHQTMVIIVVWLCGFTGIVPLPGPLNMNIYDFFFFKRY